MAVPGRCIGSLSIVSLFLLLVLLSVAPAPSNATVTNVYPSSVYYEATWLTRYAGTNVVSPADVAYAIYDYSRIYLTNTHGSYFDSGYPYYVPEYGSGTFDDYITMLDYSKLHVFIGKSTMEITASRFRYLHNGKWVWAVKFWVGYYIQLTDIFHEKVTYDDIAAIDIKHQEPDNTPLRVVFLITPYGTITDGDRLLRAIINDLSEVKMHYNIPDETFQDVSVFLIDYLPSTYVGFTAPGKSVVIAIDVNHFTSNVICPEDPTYMDKTLALVAFYIKYIYYLNKYSGSTVIHYYSFKKALQFVVADRTYVPSIGGYRIYVQDDFTDNPDNPKNILR